MGDPMLTYTLLGAPRTKKNSQRIFKGRGGQPFLVPSAAYAQYEKDCLRQIHPPRQPVAAAVNLKCVYYMPNRRRVDLVNLLDRQHPRVEIEITEMEE